MRFRVQCVQSRYGINVLLARPSGFKVWKIFYSLVSSEDLLVSVKVVFGNVKNGSEGTEQKVTVSDQCGVLC